MNKFNLGDLFHEASHGSPRREAFDLEHVAKDVSSSPVAEFMDHEINKGSLNKENVKERWDGVVGSAKMLQAQRIKHFMAQKVPAKSLKRYKKAAKAHEAAFAKYYDTVVGKIEEKNSRKDAGAESSKTPADYEMWVKGKTGKKGRKGKGGGFSTGLAKGFLN
ncbi:hypothetical protein MMC10_008862 [Thelotrema lepadinum]|nr:hypothetical protein [Thelotrema lepadinum]